MYKELTDFGIYGVYKMPSPGLANVVSHHQMVKFYNVAARHKVAAGGEKISRCALFSGLQGLPCGVFGQKC